MTLKITPGTQGSIVSDGHVVLLPPGLTGEITLPDGTTYDLGAADQIAIECDTHEDAVLAGHLISKRLHEDDETFPDIKYDEKLSLKNLGLTSKDVN